MSSTRDILDGLKEFYRDLKDYEELHHEERESKSGKELREKIVRNSGKFKPIVVNITKTRYVRAPGSGIPYDIWSEGFSMWVSHTHFFLNTLIDSVNQTIGTLEGKSSYKPSKYELTSSIYWIDRFVRWRAISVISWAKTHRLVSVIITLIMLIAAILCILEYLS